MEDKQKYDRDDDGIPDKEDSNYNPSFIEHIKEYDAKRRVYENEEQLKAAGSKPRRANIVRR